MEDLLFVLIGVDGRDITAQPVLGRQNRSFIVDPTLDMSIKELVNRILPVASYYSTLTRCVNFSRGNHLMMDSHGQCCDPV